MTRDNVSLKVNAVVYFLVTGENGDPRLSRPAPARPDGLTLTDRMRTTHPETKGSNHRSEKTRRAPLSGGPLLMSRRRLRRSELAYRTSGIET